MNHESPQANIMYKKILHIIFLVIAFVMLSACNSSASKPQVDVSENSNPDQAQAKMVRHEEDTLRYHYYKDPQNGMVQYRAPVPVSWIGSTDSNADIYIKGPNGIVINKTQTENFVYSPDPFMLQTMRQMGKRVSPVMSLEAIVRQHIKPQAEAQGYSFVTSYPMPEVNSFWQKFLASMLQTGSRRESTVLGTEWSDNSGNKSFVMITQTIMTKQNTITWGLQTTELEAPAAHFVEAKDAFIYSVVNTEINPQWIQMKNGELRGQIRRNDAFWTQKSRESARAHQQRMAAIKSWGNTSRSIAKTYSDISDISHAGYLKRSDMISAGQSKTINAIRGRTVIGNQNTGEYYNVDAGSKYYWVNNRGEYIATDNSLYDPRIDNSINDAEWTKFNVEQ